MTIESYLSAEDKARVEIDKMLGAAGWAVQDARHVNLAASRGVAVREFILEPRTVAPTISSSSTARRSG